MEYCENANNEKKEQGFEVDNVSKLWGIDYQQPNLGSQKYEINANNYTNKPGNIML